MDVDNRLTLSQYAQHNQLRPQLNTTGLVRGAFYPTVRIYCQSGDRQRATTATGEVVLRNDLLITAAHVFIPAPSTTSSAPAPACGTPFTANECYVEMTYDNQLRKIPIQSILQTGHRCAPNALNTDDWAIAKLAQGIDGAPYAVASEAELNSLRRPQPVVNATSGQVDIQENGAWPAVLTECQIRDTETSGSTTTPTRFKTDCDIIQGGSGSGLHGDQNQILGIMVSTTSAVTKDYDPRTTYSVAIPLTGTFRAWLLHFANRP